MSADASDARCGDELLRRYESVSAVVALQMSATTSWIDVLHNPIASNAHAGCWQRASYATMLALIGDESAAVDARPTAEDAERLHPPPQRPLLPPADNAKLCGVVKCVLGTDEECGAVPAAKLRELVRHAITQMAVEQATGLSGLAAEHLRVLAAGATGLDAVCGWVAELLRGSDGEVMRSTRIVLMPSGTRARGEPSGLASQANQSG